MVTQHYGLISGGLSLGSHSRWLDQGWLHISMVSLGVVFDWLVSQDGWIRGGWTSVWSHQWWSFIWIVCLSGFPPRYTNHEIGFEWSRMLCFVLLLWFLCYSSDFTQWDSVCGSLSSHVNVGVSGSALVKPMNHVAVKTGSSGRKRLLMLNQKIVSLEWQIWTHFWLTTLSLSRFVCLSVCTHACQSVHRLAPKHMQLCIAYMACANMHVLRTHAHTHTCMHAHTHARTHTLLKRMNEDTVLVLRLSKESYLVFLCGIIPCLYRFSVNGTEEETEMAANCLWLVTNSKQCPNCRSPIQKNEGCNHMKCSKVGENGLIVFSLLVWMNVILIRSWQNGEIRKLGHATSKSCLHRHSPNVKRVKSPV